MKKNILITLVLVATFFSGFAFRSFSPTNKITMKKVTGIGGVFFRSKNPEKTTEWYQKHLGLNTNGFGANFDWFESEDATKKAMTQWTPFPENTKYFGEENQEFMMNYRVDNLVDLVEELKKENVTILDEIAVYDYGKFVHILDGDGNKVELWEPID